ncbi:hypothetical protein [Ferrovibrio terrae]|uniref:hypothetical protein n=1 Tax=Ferrovibrio terrae TaxID=2594003 RepID=UPI0031378CC0
MAVRTGSTLSGYGSGFGRAGAAQLGDIGRDMSATGDIGVAISRFAGQVLQQGQAEEEAAKKLKVTAEGQQEGQAAAVGDRSPALRDGKTAEDLAFNKSVLTAYFSRQRLVVEDRSQQILLDHPDDPDAFNSRYDKLKSEVIQRLPPILKGDAEQYMEEYRLEPLAKVRVAQRKKAEGTANAVHVETITRGVDDMAQAWRIGDAEKGTMAAARVRAAIDARSDITPQQKAELKAGVDVRQRREVVLGQFDRFRAKGLDQAEGFVNDFRKATKDPGIPTDERDKLADYMDAHLRDLRREDRERTAAQKADDAEKRAGWLSDFSIRFAEGAVTEAEIEKHYSAGLLKPGERTHFRVKLQDMADREATAQAAMARVDDAIGGAVALDPRSTDDRKAMNAHYARRTLGWQKLQPAEQDQRSLMYVQATGMVPDPLKARVRGGLRGTDPGKVADAANLLDTMTRLNPQLRNEFSEDDIALGDAIASRIRLGEAPQSAVAQAQAALSVPAAERQARIKRISGDKPDKDARAWLDGQATSGWFGSYPAETGDALWSDFREAYHQHFSAQGDEGVARQMAWNQVKRVWSVSDADGSGKRWMRYAPEAIYGNEFGGAWIGEQLQADLAGNSMYAKDTAGRVRLEADPLTARERDPATGQPRPFYRVLLKDDFGAWQPMLDKDGSPMRWRPDFGQLPANLRKKYIGDPVDRARRVRDARLNSADAAAGWSALQAADAVAAGRVMSSPVGGVTGEDP